MNRGARQAGRRLARGIALAVMLAAATARAATVTVVNNDGAGEGFNDPTVVAPVGGNAATTLGGQRLAAFQFAAGIWGADLASAVTIRVGAKMDPLTCSASSAVLGQAGASTIHANFTGAPFADTWYPQALANKLRGSDLNAGADDISATFNSAIGTTCAFPSVWYYGLDGSPPSGRIDFVAVVLHEIGHGLGFQTFVNTATGAKASGFDDAYMRNLEDHGTGLLWPAMTNAERMASAVDTADLHWVGAAVVANSGGLTAGRHASGHVRMYAPSPLQGGSSVSHFDTACAPNEVMEPSYTGPLHSTSLARHLLTDIGWGSAAGGTTTTTSSTSTSSTSSTSTTSSTTSTSSSTSTTTAAPTTSSTSSTTSSTTTTSSSTSTSSTTTTSSTSTSTTSSTSTSSSTTSTSSSTSTTTAAPTTSSTSSTTSSTTTSSSTSTSSTSSTSTPSSTTSTTSSPAPPTTSTTLPGQAGTGCPEQPLVGCRTSASQRASLVLRGGGDPARHLLKWKVGRGGGAAPGDLRSPASGDTTVGICVYDASGSVQPLAALAVGPEGSCGARPCWKALGGSGGLRYRNKSGVPGGLTDVKLRLAASGELGIVVKGKGASLPMPALGLATPLVVQLAIGDPSGTTCWEAVFDAALANDGRLFKARAP